MCVQSCHDAVVNPDSDKSSIIDDYVENDYPLLYSRPRFFHSCGNIRTRIRVHNAPIDTYSLLFIFIYQRGYTSVVIPFLLHISYACTHVKTQPLFRHLFLTFVVLHQRHAHTYTFVILG